MAVIAAGLAERLPADEADAFVRVIEMEPGLVPGPDYITMWRGIGSYGTRSDGLTAEEIATPEFTRAMVTIGCGIAEGAAEWCAQRGLTSPQVTRIAKKTRLIRDVVARRDHATGEKLHTNHPGTGLLP